MYISAAATENTPMAFDIGDFILKIQFWLKSVRNIAQFT